MQVFRFVRTVHGRLLMRSSVIVETIPRFGAVYKDMGEIKTAHKNLLKIDLLKPGRRNCYRFQ